MSEEEKNKKEIKYSFSDYLIKPPAKIEVNPSKKRSLPWSDGNWDEDNFVKIENNGKRVIFELQEGNFNEDGYNGCYPIQLVRFSYQLYQHLQKTKGDRETSQIVTNLEDALLHDTIRSIKRSENNTQGTGK